MLFWNQCSGGGAGQAQPSAEDSQQRSRRRNEFASGSGTGGDTGRGSRGSRDDETFVAGDREVLQRLSSRSYHGPF